MELFFQKFKKWITKRIFILNIRVIIEIVIICNQMISTKNISNKKKTFTEYFNF